MKNRIVNKQRSHSEQKNGMAGFSINGLTPHTLAGDSKTILQFTWQ